MRWSSLFINSIRSQRTTQIILFILHTKNIFERVLVSYLATLIRHYAFFFHFNFFYPRRSRLFPIFRYIHFSSYLFARLLHGLSIKIDPSSKTFHHRFAACDEGLRSFFSLRVLIKSIKFKKTVQSYDRTFFMGLPIEPMRLKISQLSCTQRKDLRTQVDETSIKSGKVVKEIGVNPKDWVFVRVLFAEYETLQSRPHASLFVLTTNCGWAKKVRPRFLRNVFNISAGGRRKSQRRVNQEN